MAPQRKDGSFVTEMAGLIEQAVRRVDVVLALDAMYAKATYSALIGLLADRGDTIGVRLLCLEATLDRHFLGECLGRGWQVEARIAELSMMEVLLADGRLALVRVGRAAERQGSTVRDASFVRALSTFFTEVWRSAVPIGNRADLGDPVRTDLTVRILRGLNTGVTDEVAARELSVSVRTYRRHVAEIMDLLCAGSRFQAGARAAKLGLLSKV